MDTLKIDLVKCEEENLKEALNELNKDELVSLVCGLKKELSQDYESFTFECNSIPFDRIRRITGYLVGTVDRFNNGKRAEVEDRVKHGV